MLSCDFCFGLPLSFLLTTMLSPTVCQLFSAAGTFPDVYDRLAGVPGIDPDLISKLRNRSISEHMFQQKLRLMHHDPHDDNSDSLLVSLSDRQFGAWISRQDGQIADQFNSASVSKFRKIGRSCFFSRDCRPELDGRERCFGGLRMRHLCRTAEPTQAIIPTFMVQRSNEPDERTWLSADDVHAFHHLFHAASSMAIVVHGFRQSHRDVSVIHKTLLSEQTHDVIVSMKYKHAARGPLYARAIANAEVVAFFLSLFVSHVIHNSPIQPEHVHVIAFSLGTQVAHFTSRFLAESNITLGRITGLDPSAVLTTGIQLSHEDADFVDVIHTSAGYSCKKWAASYLQGRVGIGHAIGHVDFFPNGGAHQPSCSNIILNLNLACHHLMAIVYFANSIRSCNYTSFPCDSRLQPNAFYDQQCMNPGPLDKWSVMGCVRTSDASRPCGRRSCSSRTPVSPCVPSAGPASPSSPALPCTPPSPGLTLSAGPADPTLLLFLALLHAPRTKIMKAVNIEMNDFIVRACSVHERS